MFIWLRSTLPQFASYLSSFKTDPSFRPNYFVDISKQLQSKLDTMGEYKSELRKFPHPRSLKAIENNALTWGAKSGMLAAEPFVLLRGKDLF